MAGKKKVSDGYWLKFKNVRKEIEHIIEKTGDFPRQKYLAKQGKSSLAAAITSYHGGFNAVRKRMGYEPTATPSSRLSDFKYVKREVNKIIKEIGHFPTQRDFRKSEKSGLQAAITKYHGGINKFRERMGYEVITTSPETLSSWDWLSKELRIIIEENGRFPEQNYLIENGRNDIKHSIKKYHGGFRKVKTRLGFKVSITQDKSKNWKWIRRELKQIIKNNKDKFPSGEYLSSIGRNDLLGAIVRHHGGIVAAGNKLGYNQTPRGSWKDIDYAINASIAILKDLGLDYLPSQRVLSANGYGAFNVAISKYHGGIVAFREKLIEKLNLPTQKDKTESLLEAWLHE